MRATRSIRFSDQSHKRAANRYAILRSLHFDGPLQRTEFSRAHGIRKSSISSITAELIEQKFIVEQQPDSLRTPLSLNPTEPCAVVAHLTLGEIHAGRVHLDGAVDSVRQWTFPADASANRMLDLLERAIAQTLPRSPKHVLGLGVASTGIVDPGAGKPLVAAHLHQWRDVPVRERLEARFKIGTRVDNEIRCQLWASAWFDRHLRECQNMLYVGLVKAGLGGALLLDGRLVAGRTFCAGEFGHVRAGNEGRLCSCGKTDCLETYISFEAMCEEIAKFRPGMTFKSFEDLARAATEDRVIPNILDRLVGRLADVLSPILAALDPDAIVLGTPSVAFSSMLGELLRKHLRTTLGGLGASDAHIILGSGRSTATLQGIGGLVIDQCFRSGLSALRPAVQSVRGASLAIS